MEGNLKNNAEEMVDMNSLMKRKKREDVRWSLLLIVKTISNISCHLGRR